MANNLPSQETQLPLDDGTMTEPEEVINIDEEAVDANIDEEAVDDLLLEEENNVFEQHGNNVQDVTSHARHNGATGSAAMPLPNFPKPEVLFSDQPRMKQLVEDLTTGIDVSGACKTTRAENPKSEDDMGSSHNPWVVFYKSAYGYRGWARDFHTPTAKDRVTDFKRKVTNSIWPYFEKIIKNKQKLTDNEQLMKEHIRQYRNAKKAEEQHKASRQTNEDNMRKIEEHFGAGARQTPGVDTDLNLKPAPGVAQTMTPFGRGQQRASVPNLPQFTTLANAAMGNLSQLLFGVPQEEVVGGTAGLTTTGTTPLTAHHPPPEVTPAEPARKKAKVTFLFRFKRTFDNKEDTAATDVTTCDLKKTLKELKGQCLSVSTDEVFHLDKSMAIPLRDRKMEDFVTIGNSWTEPYKKVKRYTVSDIVDFLRSNNEKVSVIELHFHAKPVKITNSTTVLLKSDDEE